MQSLRGPALSACQPVNPIRSRYFLKVISLQIYAKNSVIAFANSRNNLIIQLQLRQSSLQLFLSGNLWFQNIIHMTEAHKHLELLIIHMNLHYLGIKEFLTRLIRQRPIMIGNNLSPQQFFLKTLTVEPCQKFLPILRSNIFFAILPCIQIKVFQLHLIFHLQILCIGIFPQFQGSKAASIQINIINRRKIIAQLVHNQLVPLEPLHLHTTGIVIDKNPER